MKSLILGLSLLSAFATSSKAEDPVMLGLRGALNVFTPIPEETSYKVRNTAAELLARYVKIRDGTSFSELKSSSGRKWTETKDLHLTRVTAQAVSAADVANGIAESYYVNVDAEMYRTYDGQTAKWSQWQNGRNFFLPPAIQVLRSTDNQWTAKAPMLSSFRQYAASGNPEIIPHGSKPVQVRSAALASVQKSRAAVPQAPPLPAVAKQSTAATDSNVSWRSIVGLLTLVAAFSAFLKSKEINRKSGKRNAPRNSHRKTRPPALSTNLRVTPPSLPSTFTPAESNPLDLIERKESLMTAAEQAFFDVLEPLVRSSCRVSSNVRLLDLFKVRQERGQQSTFNKISQKHIDFVLTENGTSRILCAIELDDSSHNRPDRIERDTFVNELFASQNLPLLRVPFSWTYNVPGLRVELLNAGVSLPDAA